MQQSKALAILKSGKNVFLTGSAGAGKTYVLNQYISYLKDRKVPVAVTASTGIAATHMEGQTIHSWAGIGIKDSLSLSDLRSMGGKKYLSKHLENVEVLIIDEISMLHRRQFEMVDRVLQYFKRNDLSFGGIQVIFSGDFFQLPPVSKTQESDAERFCFMSNSWVKADLNVCYLTEQYRQSDNDLHHILNEMRSNNVSNSSVGKLKTLAHKYSKGDATQLFTHNVDVDRINTQKLKEIASGSSFFESEGKGNQALQESLSKSMLAPPKLELKQSAKVMFVKNNYEEGYMNGTLGEVIGFDPDNDYPVVRIKSGKEIIAAQEEWSIKDETGKSLASVSQIPLRLAWAITVHKSQGMTLDEAEIDLRKTFEKGQGYVALSRLKDLDGLYLKGFNEVALQVNSLASRADKRFRELTDEIDQKYSIEDLERSFKSHILSSGGTINEKEIRKNQRGRDKKLKKRGTQDLTMDLLREGMSLQEVAVERDLNLGTIIVHLDKIKENHSDFDLERYRPAENLILKVRDAVRRVIEKNNPEDLRSNGSPKLSALHKALDRKISYDDIKLALIFI